MKSRKLARLNNFPPSTLTTTPHILHTRQYLTLPPSARNVPTTPPPVEVVEARARERAEKQFSFVTKEVDYRIAKAYVALAEADTEGPVNKKEGGGSSSRNGMGTESRAVDSYLDDGEWEEAERQAGRFPRIQGFPYFTGAASSSSACSVDGRVGGKRFGSTFGRWL